MIGIDHAQAKSNPIIARKLIFSDETKKTRQYGDYFAYMNYGVYKEIVKFEEHFAKTMAGNIKVFVEKEIENITNTHIQLAEVLTDIMDSFNFLTKN